MAESVEAILEADEEAEAVVVAAAAATMVVVVELANVPLLFCKFMSWLRKQKLLLPLLQLMLLVLLIRSFGFDFILTDTDAGNVAAAIVVAVVVDASDLLNFIDVILFIARPAGDPNKFIMSISCGWKKITELQSQFLFLVSR